MRASALVVPAIFSMTLALSGCGDESENKPTSTTGSGASSSGQGGAGTGGAGQGGAGSTTTSSGMGGASTSSGMGGATGSGGMSSGTGSGSSSSNGSSGVGGAGGAGGLGSPCTMGGACDPGLYCDVPGCMGQGVCAEKPNPNFQPKDKNPVCGCDGVTYWNAALAAAYGASVTAPGVCPSNTAVKCSQNAPCAANLRCNRKAPDLATCMSTTEGECWGIPPSCPLNGPQAHACSDQSCQLECNLIQSQNPWYDGACP